MGLTEASRTYVRLQDAGWIEKGGMGAGVPSLCAWKPRNPMSALELIKYCRSQSELSEYPLNPISPTGSWFTRRVVGSVKPSDGHPFGRLHVSPSHVPRRSRCRESPRLLSRLYVATRRFRFQRHCQRGRGRAMKQPVVGRYPR